MTRGALKADQFRMKLPLPPESCGAALECKNDPLLARCNYTPGEGDGDDCIYITDCNEGGKLYIKPFVIHENVRMLDAETLDGQFDFCAETEDKTPEEYVYQSGQEKHIRFGLPVDRGRVGNTGIGCNEYNSRVIIGCTFILTSFDSSGAALGSNNLLRYVWKPRTEYVRMNVKFKADY